MKRLGEFYKERVLRLGKKSLIKKELYNNKDEIKIIKDLYGWKLHFGKDAIECRSEEEARYLKVFFEAGLREIYIPKSPRYLQQIIPELEELKAKTDEIINSYLESILDPKMKIKIRKEVYIEIMK